MLYPLITQSVKNLGDLLYVPIHMRRLIMLMNHSVVLQTFIVGAELALAHTAAPGVLQNIWVLLVRFLVMPALSVLFVWFTAGRGWYVDDPLVWCVPFPSFCTRC